MDIHQSLKNCENSLRDFIAITLHKKYDENWMEKAEINPERISAWNQRKLNDNERHHATTTDENLINYADLEELKNVLLLNWEGDFADAFGDFKLIETYINILSRYRNPDIHRRPLLTFQKHLILGISGEIRNKISVFRSLNELSREGFPRIESVRDNLGNIWTPGKPSRIKSGMNIHVGDALEFIVIASDPKDGDLMYSLDGKSWTTGNVLTQFIETWHISKNTVFKILVRSERKFHAYPMGYDDRITFEYQVLPKFEEST